MYFYRVGLLIALASVIALVLSSCNLLGGASNSPEEHTHIYDSFTGPEDGFWPPAPKSATSFSGIPSFSPLQMQNAVAEAQVSIILGNDSNLNQILGNRYTSFEIDILEDTSDLARSSYFNYNTNETIDVTVSSSGEVNVDKFPASKQQPPENTEEVRKAIDLAKANFLSNGTSAVADLTGTAMLAFPDRDYFQETGNGFFPTRKLYVTFGVGGGLEPTYSALVDLSNNTVDSSGSIGRY